MQFFDAIVIYSFPFKDGKYMVDLLTRECGRLSVAVKISASVRGGRSKGAAFNRSLFQPLTLLNIIYDEKKKQLKEASIAVPYQSLVFSPTKITIVFFIAEFLRYATKEEPCNEHLYDYMKQSLLWLDTSEDHFANFHIVFLLRMMKFLGLQPNLDEYSPGYCFDLRSASFSATHPLHSDVLLGEEAQKVVALMRMDFSTMHLFKMNSAARNAILDCIIKFFRLHIPNFPEMKTLTVLRELF